MGRGSDRARELVKQPLSSIEIATRRDADRELVNPRATLDGTVVERPQPQAAPQPVFTADEGTWD